MADFAETQWIHLHMTSSLSSLQVVWRLHKSNDFFFFFLWQIGTIYFEETRETIVSKNGAWLRNSATNFTGLTSINRKTGTQMGSLSRDDGKGKNNDKKQWSDWWN